MTESPEELHVKFQHAFNRPDVDSILALYEPGAAVDRCRERLPSEKCIVEFSRCALLSRYRRSE